MYLAYRARHTFTIYLYIAYVFMATTRCRLRLPISLFVQESVSVSSIVRQEHEGATWGVD